MQQPLLDLRVLSDNEYTLANGDSGPTAVVTQAKVMARGVDADLVRRALFGASPFVRFQ